MYLKVGDISSQNQQPKVDVGDTLKAVIMKISSSLLGVTAVLEKGKLVGVITDGDLRRMLESQDSIDSLVAADIMNKNPKQIEEDELAIEALQLIEKHSITQLLVTSNGEYAGFVHLHDLLKEGIL